MLERDPLTVTGHCDHCMPALACIQAFINGSESQQIREKGRLLNKSIVPEEGPARPPAGMIYFGRGRTLTLA